MTRSHLSREEVRVRLQGKLFSLRIVDGVVHVAGGVLARPLPIDALLAVVIELGVAADELLADSIECEPRTTSPCPRCGSVSEGALSAQSCSACGHAWRTAPDDDVENGPCGPGGAH